MEEFLQYLQSMEADPSRTECAKAGQADPVLPHIHNEWEMKFFSCHVCIIPPGIIHSSSSGKDFLGSLLVCKDKLLFRYRSPIPVINILRKEDTFPYESFLQSLSLLPAWAEKEKTGTAGMIFRALIREISGNTDTSAGNDIAALIESFIEHNYYRPELSITAIAEHIGYSQQYLNRVYKKTKGISIRQKLISVRLERACELLSVNGCSVAGAAGICGWSSPFYFSTVFKKNFGISPGEFAAGNRQKDIE